MRARLCPAAVGVAASAMSFRSEAFGVSIFDLACAKGNWVIAFAVDEPRTILTIIGVFYGGQNYEATLSKG